MQATVCYEFLSFIFTDENPPQKSVSTWHYLVDWMVSWFYFSRLKVEFVFTEFVKTSCIRISTRGYLNRYNIGMQYIAMLLCIIIFLCFYPEFLLVKDSCQVVILCSVADKPVITARVGTFKRKQEVRQFLENMPRDNVDDIFSCSYMKNKRFEVCFSVLIYLHTRSPC